MGIRERGKRGGRAGVEGGGEEEIGGEGEEEAWDDVWEE